MPEPTEALEALEDRLSDAIENAMWAHEALKNDSICTCGVRNNMDGDVLTSHRVSEVVGAATVVLAALELRQETALRLDWPNGGSSVLTEQVDIRAALKMDTATRTDVTRFVTPWVGVRDAGPVVDAPQDAPKPQTHVPARERSKPVSWATVGANKARAKAWKEREQ